MHRLMVDAKDLELSAERMADLLDQRRTAVARIEAHVDRKVGFMTQPRKKTRLQERCLAETRSAEKESERRVAYMTKECRRFFVSTVEEVLAPLIELMQAWP